MSKPIMTPGDDKGQDDDSELRRIAIEKPIVTPGDDKGQDDDSELRIQPGFGQSSTLFGRKKASTSSPNEELTDIEQLIAASKIEL